MAARALVVLLQELHAHRSATGTIIELRRLVLEHAARLGPRWQALHGAGTATLLTRGLDDLEPYFTRYLPQLVLAATVTPATVLVLITQDWPAAVAVVCTLPLIPIFMILIGRMTQSVSQERLEAMDGIVDALSELFPHLLQAHLDKARARLAEAVENIDEDRLKQEFALYMQKADVDEEFSRLKTHIAEVRRIVTEQKGGVGKRLDFLMQELNREANTLGSKAIAAECTQASVELKVLIEQMREQVQNIE